MCQTVFCDTAWGTTRIFFLTIVSLKSIIAKFQTIDLDTDVKSQIFLIEDKMI